MQRLPPDRADLAAVADPDTVVVDESSIGTLHIPITVARLRFAARPDRTSSAAIAHPKGLAIDLSRANLHVRHSTGDPAHHTTVIIIWLEALVVLVFAAWLLWAMTKGAVLIAHRMIRRRRERRGQCLACGCIMRPDAMTGGGSV